MPPLTIAHLSDLHLSVGHRRENIRSARRALENALRRGASHVVLTGDIVATASRRDLLLARSILSSYGLLDSNRLTIIPGNHDIFGGVHLPEDILEFPQRCRTVDYKQGMHAFHEAFHEAFETCRMADDDHLFPFVKIIDSVMLLGMNSVSTYSPFRNPIGSNGFVGPDQREHITRFLKTVDPAVRHRVVLIHHHFADMGPGRHGTLHNVWNIVERQTMKLHGRPGLLRLFKQGNVSLVLHGHLHHNAEYIRKGIRILNGGGTVMGSPPGQGKINFLLPSPEGIRVAIRRINDGMDDGYRVDDLSAEAAA